MKRAVIILKSDPTLNRSLDSELLFFKDFIDLGIFIYSKSKPTIAKRLSDIYPLTDYINIGEDVLITDFGDTTFFGGVVSEQQYLSYKILSEHTNKGGKLIIRAPDSEMRYVDLRANLQYRIDGLKDFENLVSKSKYAELFKNIDFINYNNVTFLKNGNREFKNWQIRTLNILRQYTKDVLPDELYDKISIYPGDNLIFQVDKTIDKFQIKYNPDPDQYFIHIGFFKTVGIKKEKILKELSIEDLDLFAIGLKDNDINSNVIELKKPLKGFKYYDLLNKYLAFIFIAKGDVKSGIQYINKTIYDCYISKIPVLIYEKIDPSHKIFPNIDCYFNNTEDIYRLKQLLLDRMNRLNIVDSQSEIIKNHLKYEDRKN